MPLCLYGRKMSNALYVLDFFSYNLNKVIQSRPTENVNRKNSTFVLFAMKDFTNKRRIYVSTTKRCRMHFIISTAVRKNKKVKRKK